MLNAYLIGFYLGQMLAGSIFGVAPLIISIVKKRALIGVLSILICAAVAIASPIASIVFGVIFTVLSIVVSKR